MGNAPAAALNFVLGDLSRLANESGTPVAEGKVTPAALAELIALTEAKTINSKIAKDVGPAVVNINTESLPKESADPRRGRSSNNGRNVQPDPDGHCLFVVEQEAFTVPPMESLKIDADYMHKLGIK